MEQVQAFVAARPELPQLVLWTVLIGMAFVVRGRQRTGSKRVDLSAVRQPGWLARWRAKRGVRHPKRGVAVGYRGAVAPVHLSPEAFRLSGLIFGGPGSGKTSFIRLLVQAASAQHMGAVIIDPKGSRELRTAVTAAGGRVWTIGGPLVWDPLEADPEILADQLLEGEPEDRNAPRVFRAGARLAVTQLGLALALLKREPDIRVVVHALRSGSWLGAVKKHLGDAYVSLTEHERDGVRTFAAGLTVLLLGPAGRSLGWGSNAVRIADVMAKGEILLFSLDVNRYPETTRRVAAWAFLGLQSQLAARLDAPGPPCVVVTDEAARIGWTGRLAVDLMATGREAKVPVILASQGPSDLEQLGHNILERAAQDAAWTLVFRQGALDSARASRLLGVRPDVSTSTTIGMRPSVTRHDVESYATVNAGVGERVNVPPSALENLSEGTAWLRVPPLGSRAGQVSCVRVAWTPTASPELGDRPADSKAGDSLAVPDRTPDRARAEVPAEVVEDAFRGTPDGEAEDAFRKKVYGLIQLDMDGWRRWTGATDKQGYPRCRNDDLQKMVPSVHRYVYLWEQGDIPADWTVDHTCGLLWCMDHLEVCSRGENSRRQWARKRGDLPTGHEGMTPPKRGKEE